MLQKQKLLNTTYHPLGFYVWSLFLVESFLGTVLVFSDLTSYHKFIGMLIGVGLFILLQIIVLVLVWKKPENLTYGEEGHLKKASYGDDSNPALKKVIMATTPVEETSGEK